MPVYACYRGDCDNLAYEQSGGHFLIAQDALGRDWLCVETSLAEIPPLPAIVPELMGAQRLAHTQRLSAMGTEHILLHCPDEAMLRRKLILKTYPPMAESQSRLLQAGWILKEWTERIGIPRRLIVKNGNDDLVVEGRTPNETWYRALKKTLEPRMRRENSAMTLTFQPEAVPLRTDEYGVVRVGDSQVLLDVVIREFKRGARAEEITEAYSTLKLADVYAVIAHYLRHQNEVDEYLEARRKEAEKLRNEIEANRPGETDLRAKLLSRKEQMEQGHASARQ